MWTIFKCLLDLSQYYFCFMFWFFGCKACGVLAPRPGIPCILRWSLNHWVNRDVPLVNFCVFFFFLSFFFFHGQWVMNKAHWKLALVDKGFLLFLLRKNFFRFPEGPGCWDGGWMSALLVRREPAHWGWGTRLDPYQRTLAQGTFSVPWQVFLRHTASCPDPYPLPIHSMSTQPSKGWWATTKVNCWAKSLPSCPKVTRTGRTFSTPSTLASRRARWVKPNPSTDPAQLRHYVTSFTWASLIILQLSEKSLMFVRWVQIWVNFG